jgi:hypothetical protein
LQQSRIVTDEMVLNGKPLIEKQCLASGFSFVAGSVPGTGYTLDKSSNSIRIHGRFSDELGRLRSELMMSSENYYYYGIVSGAGIA